MSHKFRVWDHENNCWFHPTYGVYKGKMEELLLNQSGDLILRYMENGRIKTMHESMFEGRFEVNLWTTIKDINGIDIYQADIVSYEFRDEQYCYPVIWHMSAWYCGYISGESRLITSLYHAENKKIVGDIYNNPEIISENEKKG